MNSGFILLVEDRPQNAVLFVRALRMSGVENKVVVVRDGVEALDFLFGRGGYAGRDTAISPRLVVLDMHMPRMDGLETLRRIRADERTTLLPVVMFSSSDLPQDVMEAYRLGANSYVDKVGQAVPYPELVRLISRYWITVNEPPAVV